MNVCPVVAEDEAGDERGRRRVHAIDKRTGPELAFEILCETFTLFFCSRERLTEFVVKFLEIGVGDKLPLVCAPVSVG